MQYPKLSKELSILLAQDQRETKALAQTYISEGVSEYYIASKLAVQSGITKRMKRALEILYEIDDPLLSKIGRNGSVALSVLALHASLTDLQTVLNAFQRCYEKHKGDCAYDLIPAMRDWLLIQKGLPQEFGTQWLFDEDNYPFLPTVARFTTFDELNSRRAAYGREPLRWPRSLVMTEGEQPWLKRPISEAVARIPTQRELELAVSRKM